MIYIYYLHGGLYIPRYIGISNDPSRRLAQHKRSSKRTAKGRWIKRRRGRIGMIVFLRLPRPLAEFVERKLIEWLSPMLVNTVHNDRIK